MNTIQTIIAPAICLLAVGLISAIGLSRFSGAETYIEPTAFGAAHAPSKSTGIDQPGDARHLSARIDSLGLFKNGLAVVQRIAEVNADGVYEITEIPKPVHGTFWIQSAANIIARVESREIEIPLEDRSSSTNIESDLDGRRVTVYFRSGDIPPTTGRVIGRGSQTGSGAWDRDYAHPAYSRWWSNSYQSSSSTNSVLPSPPFLILENENGQVYVNPSMVAYLKVHDPAETVRRVRPVLRLAISNVDKKTPTAIAISYLTKGIAWAPSYRIDLSDPEKMVLDQKAVIRNELADLRNVDIHLISGFPSIAFQNLLSPLSPDMTWAQFFAGLNSSGGGPEGMASNMVTMQDAGGILRGAEPNQPEAVPASEDVDLYYHPVGRQTLGLGDSLMLPTADAETKYERIIQWIVADSRDEYGRYINDWRRRQDPNQYRDVAWDAVRFKNPFPFPMTTGPAMIVAGNRFHGQRTSHWVNPDEETTLRITRSLSIRTEAIENEMPGERESVYLEGRNYRRVTVSGELKLTSHRKKPMATVIRRKFSGRLIHADEMPKVTLREEGVYSVNQRNELEWNITVEPGKERVLTYTYSILVAQ